MNFFKSAFVAALIVVSTWAQASQIPAAVSKIISVISQNEYVQCNTPEVQDAGLMSTHCYGGDFHEGTGRTFQIVFKLVSSQDGSLAVADFEIVNRKRQ